MADQVQDAVSILLVAVFGLWLASIPLLIALKKTDVLLTYTYNLTFWQTAAAGFFVVGFIGMLSEGFEKVALEEWPVSTRDNPRVLHIAASYEGFWCFAMIPWFGCGLANAWLPLSDVLAPLVQSKDQSELAELAERQIRAKLSMVWATSMLCFWPIAWHMTFAYDVMRPPTVITFLGLLFVQTFIAGWLHFRDARLRAEGAAYTQLEG